MRVLIAGITGALGRAVADVSIAAGHEPVGITRDPAAAERLRGFGIHAEVADLLDADATLRAVTATAPEAVVHAAKAIPKRGPLRFGDMDATNRLHRAGTTNLLAAATAIGAQRFVAASVVFAYGYARCPTPLREDDPVLPVPSRRLAAIRDAALHMEDQVVAAHHAGSVEGVVLRVGVQYGPGASDHLARLIARRLVPIPIVHGAAWSVIHVHDAANAAIAALTGPAGEVYNVADDQPVSPKELFAAMARVLGARTARRVPVSAARAVAPYYAATITSGVRLRNDKAKALLGWRLRHPTHRDGIQSWLQQPTPIQPAP